MKLWEIEVRPADGQVDREGQKLLNEAKSLGCETISSVAKRTVFLLEGDFDESAATSIAGDLLVDPVTESATLSKLPATTVTADWKVVTVMFRPGMTDNVGETVKKELLDRGWKIQAVATAHRYLINPNVSEAELTRFTQKVLANEKIERVIPGPLNISTIAVGKPYKFELEEIEIGGLNEEQRMALSKSKQLSLSRAEMKTIQQYYSDMGHDPTDIELETIAQTWSEHCSHKTLAGRIKYQDDKQTVQYDNMLKETIFKATMQIRHSLGDNDWCVSVFKDNAGIVTFNDEYDVCIKVETHNRPSALEPYGGANTGLGGVIRDTIGTGLGGKPVCSTDVFCFAPFDIGHQDLPKGVLHPRRVAHGVVAGVRDYGNRMGIPTVNGAVYFDKRYIGNPLVYCGNVALIPKGKDDKKVQPDSLIVAMGGRTGLDGIHGATFSSDILTDKSETVSAGAVQIGNAITEKMVMDVILQARDRGLFTAITDCGAGGFSSAIGEMASETGAEVWLDRAPLKYSGLSYTEIWISEAQERMVLSVPQKNWDALRQLCEAEGVEATILGKFTDTHRLVLKYGDEQVADLEMELLHDGRPPVIRDAIWKCPDVVIPEYPDTKDIDCNDVLAKMLAHPNVASKEWIIRQYDHEVLAGSVVKPLVGVKNDGPSDASVVQPDLKSERGIVIGCGMNPSYGDLDPYWMAASAIDEAVRNCVAVGANPAKIAILDNFCWGNTNRAETLGALVRTAQACHDISIAYMTPFVSGKDSLHNEFSYHDGSETTTVSIPHSLLITALGQIEKVTNAVTMDAKSAGSLVYLVGATKPELGGSLLHEVLDLTGGQVPQVDHHSAPSLFQKMNQTITAGHVASCHDLSAGGLAVAAAEMAFAGGFGMKLNLTPLAGKTSCKTDLEVLFSESNTRFLVEVPAASRDAFEFDFSGQLCYCLGEIVDEPTLSISGLTGREVIRTDIAKLKEAWKNGIAWEV